jgi:hypothetical protein
MQTMIAEEEPTVLTVFATVLQKLMGTLTIMRVR